MGKSTSSGSCNACGKVFGKAAMTRHLKSCLESRAAASDKPAKGPTQSAIHLLVEGRYAPEYWLHLQAPAVATLEKLDRFLRRIWLECCGHMSAFTIGAVRYSSGPTDDPFYGLLTRRA